MSGFTSRQPFDEEHVASAPSSPGVYIIYDLAGAIYCGSSGSSIRRRLQSHLNGRGNRNIARAIQLGASGSLSFKYFRTAGQNTHRDAEAYLIRQLGVHKFGNLRREALPEDREGFA